MKLSVGTIVADTITIFVGVSKASNLVFLGPVISQMNASEWSGVIPDGLCGFALVLGGVAILRLKRWSRRLLLWSAGFGLAGAMLDVVVNVMMKMPIDWSGSLRGGFFHLTPYVLILWYFNRPAVKLEFQSIPTEGPIR